MGKLLCQASYLAILFQRAYPNSFELHASYSPLCNIIVHEGYYSGFLEHLSWFHLEQMQELLIITQNTNPPQQSTVTILAFLERWWQEIVCYSGASKRSSSHTRTALYRRSFFVTNTTDLLTILAEFTSEHTK